MASSALASMTTEQRAAKKQRLERSSWVSFEDFQIPKLQIGEATGVTVNKQDVRLLLTPEPDDYLATPFGFSARDVSEAAAANGAKKLSLGMLVAGKLETFLEKLDAAASKQYRNSVGKLQWKSLIKETPQGQKRINVKVPLAGADEPIFKVADANGQLKLISGWADILEAIIHRRRFISAEAKVVVVLRLYEMAEEGHAGLYLTASQIAMKPQRAEEEAF